MLFVTFNGPPYNHLVNIMSVVFLAIYYYNIIIINDIHA